MIIYFDPETHQAKLRRYTVVLVKRNKKGNINFSSGIIYFTHKRAMDKLTQALEGEYEIHYPNVYKAVPTETPGKGYWCPYCRTWEFWKADGNGYKVCPVCGMSDNDYYVRVYNKLWSGTMGSMGSQKHKERMKKTNARRK